MQCAEEKKKEEKKNKRLKSSRCKRMCSMRVAREWREGGGGGVRARPEGGKWIDLYVEREIRDGVQTRSFRAGGASEIERLHLDLTAGQ